MPSRFQMLLRCHENRRQRRPAWFSMFSAFAGTEPPVSRTSCSVQNNRVNARWERDLAEDDEYLNAFLNEGHG